MIQIITYMTFNGNCREAMQFYQACLGGELYLQTVGESPMADKLPEEVKEYILHSSLTNGTIVLMGTDMVPEEGLVRGNSISIMVECNSIEEITTSFQKLSEGGTTLYPLQETFFGALFGELEDKYGNHWLLNFYQRKNKEENLNLNK